MSCSDSQTMMIVQLWNKMMLISVHSTQVKTVLYVAVICRIMFWQLFTISSFFLQINSCFFIVFSIVYCRKQALVFTKTRETFQLVNQQNYSMIVSIINTTKENTASVNHNVNDVQNSSCRILPVCIKFRITSHISLHIYSQNFAGS